MRTVANHRRARLRLVGVMLAAAFAVSAADDRRLQILGNWLTEPKNGIIQITAVGGTFEGRIVGGNQPTRVDEKNPDANLRGKSLKGQLILRGLRYDSDGQWSGGTIYDPDSGRTYRCNVSLIANDVLKVRGFIGISLIGKSQLWTRYSGTSLNLPAAR